MIRNYTALLTMLLLCNLGCQVVVFSSELGEECSDGIDNDENGAIDCQEPSCAQEPVCLCGNGSLDGAEECDDTNANPGDGCDAACAAEDGFTCQGNPSDCVATCGDGVTVGDEVCDDGNTDSGDGCRDDCLKIEVCGDALLDDAEECDDGNVTDGDGCQSSCLLSACGDGVVDPGEACDDANNIDGDGCNANCALSSCGNGVVDPGEECDDGNNFSGDSCNAFCFVEACGNGFIEPGEVCDDANITPGDGCSAQCQVELCGNGALDPGEECDDGNNFSGDSCNAFCFVEVCGNGFTESPEECDDANNIDGDGCEADCTLPLCGNNTLDQGEGCDDANITNGDGCNALCQLEFCGDGNINNNNTEACDDANLSPGDGCDAVCAIENGFTCQGNPSVCVTICGDGLTAGLEECDDANTLNGDGCEAECTLICGNGSGADRAFLEPASQHCYLGFDAPLDWQSARDDCAALGTHLVTIESAEENDFARAVGSFGETWIGLNDLAVEGSFEWVNGEPVVFTDFGPGEPNDEFGEDCVHFFPNLQPVWNDRNCADIRPYVCELETPLCGNGFFETGEACDDANATDGDGCDALCAIETGFLCVDSPSVCVTTCGDEIVAGAEECDDGNLTNGDGCNADCVRESICGDTLLDLGEVCDDGNTAPDDGCRADCEGLEICGDGILDTVPGEECDDGNLIDGDGCDDACILEVPFATAPPQVVSGILVCNTNFSNTGRKITTDALGTFYVVMNCGGEAFVAVSDDRSVTYSAPLSLGITGVIEVAIEGGPADTAYAVAITNIGELVFTRSIDGGLTWDAPIILDTGAVEGEVSIDSNGDSVFIAISLGTSLRVFRNNNRGVGGFASVDIAQSNVFHEMIVDKATGDVFMASDDPAPHIRRSTDGAVSFGAQFDPPGEDFFSDWAGSNGFLYIVGTDFNGGGATDIDVVPVSDLSSGFAVDGLPNTTIAQARAIDADGLGNAYVISQLDSGAIQLDRMLFGASSILSADARQIAAVGTFPGVAAIPSNNGAVVVFTQGTAVLVAVQVY